MNTRTFLALTLTNTTFKVIYGLVEGVSEGVSK